MTKKESNFINMALTLFLVTFIASTALGLVYNITKDPIQAAKQAKRQEAIQNVVTTFDNRPLEETKAYPSNGDTVKLYIAKEEGSVVGVAVETFTNQGFSGKIKLMVGFLPDGTIHNISVLQHEETPGLGDKIEKSKSDFIQQFKGKKPADFQLNVKKDGGEVDAITAATVSSRAFCDAVKRAYEVFQKFKES